MESLLATPVKPLELMIGKPAPCVLLGLTQTVVTPAPARVVFDVPFYGVWGALVSCIRLFIIGSLALGFLISTMARNQLQAIQMSIFYILLPLLLSGFMFPFRGMPVWAQIIRAVIPITRFLRVVRGALLKGLGFADLWQSLAALTLFVVVVSLAMAHYRSTLD